MKKNYFAAAALIAVALFVFLQNRPSSPKSPNREAVLLTNNPAPKTESSFRAPGLTSAPSVSENTNTSPTNTNTNSAPALPPDTVLQNIRRAFHQYSQTFGGNPVGTNPEITASLSGNNPKKINFIDAESGMVVNGDGQLVDAWGTPYFFHQLSAHEMEIHSAGPDKKMWTADDLTTK